MRVNTKIMFLVPIALILMSAVISILVVWQLNRTGNMAIGQIERLGIENIKKIRADGKRQERTFRQELLLRKKEYLESHIQIAFSILHKSLKDAEEFAEDGLNDEVKKAIILQQKEDIAQFMSTIRYGPENRDYFLINDMHPKMIMNPDKPEMNGKDLSDIGDPNGKKIFMEFVKVCREKGEGFVDYYWPKDGTDKPQPKLSFVKHFKEWDWVVGTGVYTDDIETVVEARKGELEKEVKASTAKMKLQIESIKNELQGNRRHVLMLIGVITLIVLVLILTASYIFIHNSITKPINRIIKGLNEGAEHVAGASQQISSASQSLAEGASEQASSIEETSASLEEISSMTKNNAENATQADNLMKETNQVVGDANESMAELTESMEEMTRANDETQKIIKTIDEIAFQTNLLALNAAVEAARAGEAGAGFAVVAEEVRNLAMRSAEAAKNTASMIEGTVKKTKDGSDIVRRTNEAFSKVAESSEKVGKLVGEIAAASSEQAQGIEQVTSAVGEMDKVVQQNAASAEESASASEEMNAQAEKMKGNVNRLISLFGGSDKEKDGRLSIVGRSVKL